MQFSCKIDDHVLITCSGHYDQLEISIGIDSNIFRQGPGQYMALA